MYPIFGVNFGRFPIYQVMLGIAFLAAFILLESEIKNAGKFSPFMRSRVRKSYLFGGVVGLAGANVINWLIMPGLRNASLYERITQGGVSSFFCIMLFFGAAALALRLYKANVTYCLTLTVRPILLAQFFGRIGCSLAGCCWGKTVAMFGHSFLFPARELEAIFALTLFIVFHKRLFSKRLRVYLIAYPLFRFIVDFFRGGEMGSLFGITVPGPVQIFALLTALVTAGVVTAKAILKKKNGAAPQKRAYTPRPNSYTELTPKKHPLRTVAIVLCSLTAVFAVFVFLNPLKLRFLDNIRLFVQEAFTRVSAVPGTETALGETDGIHLLAIESYGAVPDEAAAVRIAQSFDALETVPYQCTRVQTLANGGKAYVLTQTVNGTPVLGCARVLVTDQNGNAAFLLGDDAALTRTEKISDSVRTSAGVFAMETTAPVSASYLTLNSNTGRPDARTLSTVKELFPEATELERQEIYYDTGTSLVFAYQAILSTDGQTPAFGVVAEAATNEFITMTSPRLGEVPNIHRGQVLHAAEEVIGLLSEGNSDEIDRIYKENKNVPNALRTQYSVRRALCCMIRTAGLTPEQTLRILTVSYQIADALPGLNAELFREIVITQTEKALLNDGKSQEEAAGAAKKAERAFTRNHIEQKTDENATQIDAGGKNTSFRHSIDYTNDSDLYEIVTKPDSITTVSIRTETPVIARFYRPGKGTVVSIPVEKEETVQFYPEDGTVIRLQITDFSDDPGPRTSPARYTIETSSTEETEEGPPAFVLTLLKRVNDAYERSNLTSFISLFTDEQTQQISAEEAIGYGLLAPGLDHLSSCCGLEEGVDTAKTVIASVILPENALPEDQLFLLRGTEMDLECVSCLSRGDWYAVKAHIVIRMDQMHLYNGYTLLRVEKATPSTRSSDSGVSTLERMLSYFRDQDYKISQINTVELYQIFGSAAATNDIQSLYDLWVPMVYHGNRITTQFMTLDESRVAAGAYSDEKLESFRKYTVRYNLLNLKMERMTYKHTADLFISVGTYGPGIKELYDAATDPFGYLIDKRIEQNESANEIWTIVKFIYDPTGELDDMLLESFLEEMKNYGEEMMLIVDEYDTLIETYRARNGAV